MRVLLRWQVSREQQLVLLAILAAVVLLCVAVGMVSNQTDVWSNARSGATMVLGVLFASLVRAAAHKQTHAELPKRPLEERTRENSVVTIAMSPWETLR